MSSDPLEAFYSTSSNTSTTPSSSAWPDASAATSGAVVPSDEGLQGAKTPIHWLVAALAVGVAAAVGALLIGSESAWSIAPWVAAGPVGFLLIGWFSRRDAVARAAAWYTKSRLAKVLYPAAVVAVLGATVWASFQFATWVGRL
jgi:hypothetical protein